MRSATLVVLTFALVSGLTACGLGDSPEKAAEEWVQAFANLDGNKINERTCAAQRPNVQQAGMWSSVFSIFSQQTIGQPSKTDISGLKFATVSNSGHSANVRVTGQIRVAVLALSQTQDIDETWGMVQEEGEWNWCGQVSPSAPSPRIALPTQIVSAPPQLAPATHVAESPAPVSVPRVILQRLGVSFLGQDGNKVIGSGCPGDDYKGTITDYHFAVRGVDSTKQVKRVIVAGGLGNDTWEWPCVPNLDWALVAKDSGGGNWDVFIAPSARQQMYTMLFFHTDNTFALGLVQVP